MGLVFEFGGSSVVGLGSGDGGWANQIQPRFNKDFENHYINEQHVSYNRGRTAELITKTLIKVKQDILIFESEPLQKLAIINSGIIDAAFNSQRKRNLVPLRDYIICKRNVLSVLNSAGYTTAVLAPPPMPADEIYLSDKIKYIKKDRDVYALADQALAFEAGLTYIAPDYQKVIDAGKPVTSRDGFHSSQYIHEATFEPVIDFIYSKFGHNILQLVQPVEEKVLVTVPALQEAIALAV